MSLLGFGPEDYEEVAVEVWPENVTALNVFIGMWTQWRMGYAGPYGLDYAALPAVMDMIEVPRDERADVFECLRVMEREAIPLLNPKD